MSEPRASLRWSNDTDVVLTDTDGAREERLVDSRPPGGPAPGLTEREVDVLAFERQWWRYAGAKEAAVREQFDWSATRYYQVLNALVDRPEALAHDPMLVKRLRRMRATRQRTRTARRLGIDLTTGTTGGPR